MRRPLAAFQRGGASLVGMAGFSKARLHTASSEAFRIFETHTDTMASMAEQKGHRNDEGGKKPAWMRGWKNYARLPGQETTVRATRLRCSFSIGTRAE